MGAPCLQGPGTGRMVRVRVGADDGHDVPAAAVGMGAGIPEALHMRIVSRAGVDHHVAAVCVPHHVAVGAGAGHEARVGGGQPLHIAR